MSGDFETGVWIGRAWLPEVSGPAVVTLHDGRLMDITARGAATVSAVAEMENPAAYVREAPGRDLGDIEGILNESPRPDRLHLLAPIDLQAIKACGVTFARSVLERVIEERAGGDAKLAEAVREKVKSIIGVRLQDLVPGSDAAMRVKAALIDEGFWSQYLEVGIGPDAEVFTKAQPMSAVGTGARIGILPASQWNNPEPEVVLLVNSRGTILGATLGNDVNLRDFEGRSALLLGKAKDNNASCALGPMIRLFDDGFTLDDVRVCRISLCVEGTDGFRLEEHCSMAEISRDPADLVAQTIGVHHGYPDGLVLFLGSLFAPIADRREPGQGFTHELGDSVRISAPGLGVLENTVALTDAVRPWTFGVGSLIQNIAGRGLL